MVIRTEKLVLRLDFLIIDYQYNILIKTGGMRLLYTGME
jgi:hypothetical protein